MSILDLAGFISSGFVSSAARGVTDISSAAG